jgi:fumarate hydratase subunit beta
METLNITSPFSVEAVEKLEAGRVVKISGIIYSARDVAHKRLVEAMEKDEELPLELKGQTIYYMGPSPARPGRVIGAAGPTTSARMDGYTPKMLEAGVKAFIGKGDRSPEVKEALVKNEVVYLSAIGGAGALLSKTIKKVEVVAYEELGAEAIMKLTVDDFPAVVALDIYGGDLFKLAKAGYKSQS